MKFSEFLTYSKPGSTAPAVSEPVKSNPPSSVSKVSPVSAASAASFSPPPPVIDIAIVEKRIRGELQAQFQSQLEQTRRELENYFNQQLEVEKQKVAAKEDTLNRLKQNESQEKQKIEQDKIRDLEEYKKQIESSLHLSLEAEKSKLKITFEQELQQAKQSLDGFQKLLEIREKELYEAKKKLEMLIQPSDHSSSPSIVPTPVQVVIPKETVLPSKAESHPVVPPSPVSLGLPASSAFKPIEKKEEKVPLVVFHEDAKAEALAKSLRDQMVTLGEKIFEQATHGHTLELDSLKGLLSSFIEGIKKRDLEAMRVALEAYPEDRHFTYHCVNTAILSLILGLEFSFSEEEMMGLGLAAFLHDVGLVNVREDLNYPKKLTPQLENAILNHPARGVEILQGVLSPLALDAILQHHEIGNGKGYPKGLMEKDIHIFSSILHVVDSFEALIHERPYRRKPLEVNEAMKQLIDTGRGVYDRNVLKALMVRVGLYPVMSYVELSNKQIGRVVLQNRQYPLSPVVQMEYDESGNKLSRVQLVDLSQSQFIHIMGPVKKESGANYSTSRFASTEPTPESPKEAKKRETMDFIQHAISLFLILTVIIILIYVVIKV